MERKDFYKELSELNNDELEKVFNNNKKLQDEVFESFQNDTMFWINEYLDTLNSGLKDWSIGYCNYNFIKIKDNESFVDAVQEMQKKYEFLYKKDDPEYYTNLIDKIKKQLERLETLKSDKAYNKLEEKIDENIQTLINDVLSEFNNQLRYKPEYIFDYFMNEWLCNIAFEDQFYIDSDYVLLQDIQYTKSYK